MREWILRWLGIVNLEWYIERHKDLLALRADLVALRELLDKIKDAQATFEVAAQKLTVEDLDNILRMQSLYTEMRGYFSIIRAEQKEYRTKFWEMDKQYQALNRKYNEQR